MISFRTPKIEYFRGLSKFIRSELAALFSAATVAAIPTPEKRKFRPPEEERTVFLLNFVSI